MYSSPLLKISKSIFQDLLFLQLLSFSRFSFKKRIAASSPSISEGGGGEQNKSETRTFGVCPESVKCGLKSCLCFLRQKNKKSYIKKGEKRNKDEEKEVINEERN
jgi:hypothetical protein